MFLNELNVFINHIFVIDYIKYTFENLIFDINRLYISI